ncbi:MAG: NADH-quinone oxidoreductase subunit NuoE [Chlorobi bacterium]|nr:NADH-quinone oxidoreductase subunit NuoE [Chlorobiota bacterium]
MTEVQHKVKELSEKYGRKRENLLPILQGIVEHEHYLTDTAMVQVAKELDVSTAEVYGTATFYSFLDTEPRGKYVIRVCKTISCDMKGKNAIIKAIEDMLKIKVGETTQNKMFTLLQTNCLGWCHKAPAILINDEPYTELTPVKVKEILSGYIHNDNAKQKIIGDIQYER